jgi:hypothetical protein
MDQIAAVLKGLPEGYCRVLELRLQGRSAAEIAARLALKVPHFSAEEQLL